MANNSAQEVVIRRNQFYVDGYRNLLKTVIIMGIAIVILLISNFYFARDREQPQYFATTHDGRLVPLTPLSQPNLSTATLLTWVTEAVTSTHTYDFKNYRKQFQDNSIYFTPKAWEEFQKAVVNSGNLEALKQKRLIASAYAAGAPVILRQGEIPSGYAWSVQFPFNVVYEGGGRERIEQKLLASVIVTRVSVLDDPKGIAIAQMTITERGQENK